MSTNLPSFLPSDGMVEAYELGPTWSLWGVAENFSRLQILLTVFDADPEKWIDFIDRHGTERERQEDLPFLLALKQRIEEDPSAVDAIRNLVASVHMLFGPRVQTA